jgi:hypothetical protein
MADERSRRDVHELNNLFQVIVGSLELIRRQRGGPAETVDTALRAAREAAALAQRLLGSARDPDR